MARPRDPASCAVAFAASTGGPAALEAVFAGILRARCSGLLPAAALPPFFVTQHISAPFYGVLADHLSAAGGMPCREAQAGELVAAGQIYIAPADHHLGVQCGIDGNRISLMQTPPVHFFRPAADPMLESLAKAYGENLLAVILTGMGKDGLTGCHHVANAGGVVWAQDAKTSVVWGMPGAVAGAELCQRVLPLGDIGAAAVDWLYGARP